jgi:hypothetical protein
MLPMLASHSPVHAATNIGVRGRRRARPGDNTVRIDASLQPSP